MKIAIVADKVNKYGITMVANDERANMTTSFSRPCTILNNLSVQLYETKMRHGIVESKTPKSPGRIKV